MQENSEKEYEEMNEDREPSFIYKDGKQSKVNLILAARTQVAISLEHI